MRLHVHCPALKTLCCGLVVVTPSAEATLALAVGIRELSYLLIRACTDNSAMEALEAKATTR